ncbi:MAG: cobyrinate a,c-diamide synthase, partial [Firmicutes bacterium]|nr:cobyrinate a,c-diamide synthase [Bacillota bacterium]
GSTTGTPALLVIDGKGQSLSMAAVVGGMAHFRKDSRIKGVLLNRTKKSMYQVMAEAIEAETGVPVLGYVPEDSALTLESRHLGLVMPEEIADLKERINAFSRLLEETVDMDRLIEIAAGAEDIEPCCAKRTCCEKEENRKIRPYEGLKIAVARDEAFCFIYEDNIELLGSMGADITWFSPLHDEKLPDGIDGLLLYGGYPELHGRELSANRSMRKSVADAIKRGIPCMAECGGFIYLHHEFEDSDGVLREGAGVTEGRAFRTERLTRFGYINIESEERGFLTSDDSTEPVHAHEFHYYDSTSNGGSCIARKPKGKRSWRCIHQEGNLLAGFPHFYYRGCPQLAENFLKRCRKEAEKRMNDD